jgi:hypothetical protein
MDAWLFGVEFNTMEETLEFLKQTTLGILIILTAMILIAWAVVGVRRVLRLRRMKKAARNMLGG